MMLSSDDAAIRRQLHQTVGTSITCLRTLGRTRQARYNPRTLAPPIVLLTGLYCAFALELAAQETVRRVERSIDFATVAEQAVVRLPVDTDVYSRTADGLTNLRVLNGAGAEVPYLLRRQTRSTTRTIEKTWTVTNAEVQPGDDAGLGIRFRLQPDDPTPRRLEIDTPLQNFEQTARLFAVVDGQEVLLVDQELLFDYSRIMDVRRTAIPVPPTTAREFRLVIASPTAIQESLFVELTRELQPDGQPRTAERLTVERRPFRINRLLLVGEQLEPASQESVLVEYPISQVSSRHDPDSKETIIRLKSRREPLQRLVLNTTSRNFSRQVELRTRSSGEKFDWAVGTASIRRFEFGTIHEAMLDLPVSGELRTIDLELAIQNRDSPPLDVTGVTAYGYVDELVFFADPEERYRLVHAPLDTPRPDYDLAALHEVLRSDAAIQNASLGPVRETHFPIEKSLPAWSDLWNDPRILAGIILVLVIVLGCGLYRAAQRVDALSQNNNGG